MLFLVSLLFVAMINRFLDSNFCFKYYTFYKLLSDCHPDSINFTLYMSITVAYVTVILECRVVVAHMHS